MHFYPHPQPNIYQLDNSLWKYLKTQAHDRWNRRLTMYWRRSQSITYTVIIVNVVLLAIAIPLVIVLATCKLLILYIHVVLPRSCCTSSFFGQLVGQIQFILNCYHYGCCTLLSCVISFFIVCRSLPGNSVTHDCSKGSSPKDPFSGGRWMVSRWDERYIIDNYYWLDMCFTMCSSDIAADIPSNIALCKSLFRGKIMGGRNEEEMVRRLPPWS